MLAGARTEPRSPTSHELVALVRDLFREAGGLVQDEGALLRAEVRRDVARMRRAVVGFGIAAALLNIALLAWCASAVLALAESVGAVQATLILGGVFAAAGGVALFVSRRLVSSEASEAERRPSV